MNHRRERNRSLLLLPYMTQEEIIKGVESLVNEILEPQYFLVDVKMKPVNNLKIYVDGDNGISVKDCININRALYKKLEANAYFPAGDFSLEVSSPGVDKPLKLHRQYIKNIGRIVEIDFNYGTKNTGELLQVTEQDILLKQKQVKAKKQQKRSCVYLLQT